MQNTPEMLAFYRGLGFQLRETETAVSVYIGDQMINFHRPGHWNDATFTLRAPAAKPPCGDLCFVWEGTPESLKSMLDRAGATVFLGPIGRQGGRMKTASSVYVRDPDGNLLEFMIIPDRYWVIATIEEIPMDLRFYNTLTQTVEPFAPLNGNVVRMYTCGPTVYNYAHIGNLRAFTFQDLLRRWLHARGYTLDHVMNITDVEDKIIRNAAAANQTIYEYTAQYTQAFLEDMSTLRLEKPGRLVKATDHIPEMVSAIETLTERGYTYVSDGSVYYRIAKFPTYGKLRITIFRALAPRPRGRRRI